MTSSDPLPFLFDAALLAGGRSRRMGRDKAFLDSDGQLLWRRQVGVLSACRPVRLFLAARSDQPWEHLDESLIRVDDPEGEDIGPIGAIGRCLALANRPLLVMAVDLPNMTADFVLQGLLRKSELGARGVIPRVGEQFEPLCALYVPQMLPLLQTAIAAGKYALQPLARSFVGEGIATAVDLVADELPLFHNANTPADWQG
ncbi:MAG: molybdenum cofactor guanylyltransferase [Verrucomicrobiales bacterium]|nr:molybdenum cofactor guanylyltransferase [Verrucomicrobiales bacterium]MCP5559919.1 molybdenum cofactor guanylyltransferase [Verrucomicrobiaceae bacterium]